MTCQLIHADCRDALRLMTEASVDAIVTDPPYELGFMGKRWDASGIAFNINLWRECLRVLKPGGHLLAFSGTRTYHRMACAIEDAGFEIRDSINWLYGSGFPKSLDVSKAIDKAAGAERWTRKFVKSDSPAANMKANGQCQDCGKWKFAPDYCKCPRDSGPATDTAKQWAGWGTALKPAHEPIVVARKPLDGTVAANVLAHGTGAINVDGCRVACTDETPFPAAGYGRHDTDASYEFAGDPNFTTTGVDKNPTGRWPANVVLDDTIADAHPDWARYFYCAKPSKVERNAGLDGLATRAVHRFGAGISEGIDPQAPSVERNHHPTVKPLALMRWLVRLVTPPGGTVLDPFTGSGTTLVAAVLEGFNAIGIEMTDDYLPIINGRIAWAQQQPRDLFGGAA